MAYADIVDSLRASDAQYPTPDREYLAALDGMGVSDISILWARSSDGNLTYRRSIVVGTGVIIFIFSLAIPVFNDLLTLISAICGTPLTVFVPTTCTSAWIPELITRLRTLPCVMWIWETRRTRTSAERGLLWWGGVVTCLFLIALTMFISVAGTISAVVSMNNAVQAGDAAPFSCADNSI